MVKKIGIFTEINRRYIEKLMRTDQNHSVPLILGASGIELAVPGIYIMNALGSTVRRSYSTIHSVG